MEDRFTCALSTIKLYIIYGHVGLFIRASPSLKDDLHTTDFELTISEGRVFTRSVTVEAT